MSVLEVSSRQQLINKFSSRCMDVYATVLSPHNSLLTSFTESCVPLHYHTLFLLATWECSVYKYPSESLKRTFYAILIDPIAHMIPDSDHMSFSHWSHRGCTHFYYKRPDNRSLGTSCTRNGNSTLLVVHLLWSRWAAPPHFI